MWADGVLWLTGSGGRGRKRSSSAPVCLGRLLQQQQQQAKGKMVCNEVEGEEILKSTELPPVLLATTCLTLLQCKGCQGLVEERERGCDVGPAITMVGVSRGEPTLQGWGWAGLAGIWDGGLNNGCVYCVCAVLVRSRAVGR
jgi:hypothetical protein